MKTGNSRFFLIIIGVVLAMGLFGCGKQKFQVNFDSSGFESKKTSYAPGDEVTVYYNMIATDTDYSFSIDYDVELKMEFDGQHGYVFTFIMPEHDVTMHVDSVNSMEYDPSAHLPEAPADLESEIKEENLEFGYSWVVTGIDETRDKEYKLYERDSDAGYILVRRMTDGEFEEEGCCLVPDDTWDYCMNIVRSYGLADWTDGSGPRGKTYTVTFPDPSGNIMNVTSDHMPEDGWKPLEYIEDILDEAWGQYYTP